MPAKSAKKEPAILRQVCELIPPHMVSKLAGKYEVRSRSITPWNHVVSTIYAQFSHAIGPNDACDALRANRSMFASIGGAQPPSRNGLSTANRTRDPWMAEDLFWEMMGHLESLHPAFGRVRFSKLPRRFKRTVHAVDSSTIRLVANGMDWAAP